MNLNFNIGKNTNQINDTEPKDEDVLEEQTVETKKTKNDDMKKRMYKFMGIVCGGIIIILLLVLVLSLFTKKQYSYTEIEKILANAAESYFKDHSDYLPKKEDQIVEVDAANLIAAEKMNPLSEYTGEGQNCSATVQVQKVGTEYLYTPYLNCGDKYITQELYKKVLSENDIVTSGYGLYNQGGIYTFRGEKVNNYVKLDNTLWRIVKIKEDNSIVLISEDKIGELVPWDDRYNEEAGYASGLNNYLSSRVKENLDELYKKKEDAEDSFLSSNDKKKIISYNTCVGKRTIVQTGIDNSIECSSVAKTKVSLLTLSDYMGASIDTNCITAESRACQNYNYLVTDYSWWLITAVNGTSDEVYSISNSGRIDVTKAGNYASIRPVIYLNNRTLVNGGKGTESNPYTIK